MSTLTSSRAIAFYAWCSISPHRLSTDRRSFRWNHVQGHRQITDVYLLALVVSNQGRLATFDSTISLRAVEGAKAQNLEIIAA